MADVTVKTADSQNVIKISEIITIVRRRIHERNCPRRISLPESVYVGFCVGRLDDFFRLILIFTLQFRHRAQG